VAKLKKYSDAVKNTRERDTLMESHVQDDDDSREEVDKPVEAKKELETPVTSQPRGMKRPKHGRGKNRGVKIQKIGKFEK